MFPRTNMKVLIVSWCLTFYGIAVSAHDTNAFRLTRGLSPVRPKRLFNPSRPVVARSQPSSSPGYTELALNGGFDFPNSLDHWNVALWDYGVGDISVYTISTGTHSGSTSYALFIDTPYDTGENVRLSQTVIVESGKQYQLTAWTRRPDPNSGCVFTLFVAGHLVGSSDINEASDDWRQTTVAQYFTATSMQVEIALYGECNGGPSSNNKRIYIDDVSFHTV